MLRSCRAQDFDAIQAIINDGAQAYKGVIPTDRWSEPYMSRQHLEDEIAAGVTFWGVEEAGALIGVMGVQQGRDVALIRHAYVQSASQKRGVGTALLAHLRTLTEGPVLIGTWADAIWAIRFYERHGFRVVDPVTKERLLRSYWTVPERQIAASVVLLDQHWSAENERFVRHSEAR